MQCTLYIPNLIPPRELGDALWRSVDAPWLKILLARAALTKAANAGTESHLCGAFSIARQHDWPLAPLLAQQENLAAASGYWLCATPGYLEARRNALVLTDPLSLNITAAESTAFSAMLAAHLHEENVTLHAPHPGQWFLRCDTPPAMTTTSLGTVIGRDVRPFLPHGPESLRWHRILTEIQMLLHAHAANDAREADGQVPVNSVWLWGGGTLPPPAPAPFATVWSDDAIVRALAQHSGCPVQSRPAAMTVPALEEGSHLFSCELLTACLRRGDVQAWSTAVTALDRDWFMPLLGALKSRRLSTVTLICSTDADTHQFTVRPRDLLKFWRKNKYLE